MSKSISFKRIFVATILAIVVTSSTVFGSSQLASADSSVSRVNSTSLETVQFVSLKKEERRMAAVSELSEAIVSAESVLTLSAGTVSDEATRSALSALLSTASLSLETITWDASKLSQAELRAAVVMVKLSQASFAEAAAIEAARVEAERVAAEAARVEAARVEAERVATQAAKKSKTAQTPSGPVYSTPSAKSKPAQAAPAATPSGVQALNLGACFTGGANSASAVQSIIDGGCTAGLTYGPSQWIAAHDYLAGNSWKAMSDGQLFTYNGQTYQVTGRNSVYYATGDLVDLKALVYGDLTLQTCISSGHIGFIHADIVG